MKPVSSDPGQNGQSGQSGQNAETSTRTGMAATRPLPALLPLLLLLAMAMPMLVLYAMGALGPMLLPAWQIQAGQLGWISSTSFALAAVLSLWAGRVVAQLGARRSLIALFLALALAYALMISLHGFAGVVLALAVGSLAQALCNPATNLLIAQQVPAAHKARVVGLKQAGVQLAALFAGLVLPAMAQQWGWQWALGSMLPLAMAMAWLCWRWIPAPAVAANDGNNSGNNNSGNNAATPAGGWRGMLLAPDWPNSRLRWLMGVQWCVGVALSAFVTFLPLFAHGNGLSVAQGGMLLALFGAMGLLSRVVLTPLAARMRDESRLLCGLLLVAAAGLLLLMQSGQASWPLWLAAALMGLTAVATNAIAMAMLLRDAQFGPPAQSASLLSVAFFAGMASGPALFGWSLDQGRSFGFAWLVLVGVLLLGALLASALSLLRARAGTAVAPQPGTEATIAGGRQA